MTFKRVTEFRANVPPGSQPETAPDPPPPDRCTETKWQSKQKHAFLEAYFRIWTDQVGRKHGTRPTLSIIDPFAAHGWCHDKESGHTWEGTAILSARCYRDYPSRFGNTLILNSFHPDHEELAIQFEALQGALEREGVALDHSGVTLLSAPLEEAVDFALRKVDLRFPNVWVLDPYKPEDLPWATVERIARSSAEYESKGKVERRHPEIFINLMTHAIQRNIDLKPEVFSKALGVSEEEWRPLLEELVRDGMNVRQAVIELYCQRLQGIYGRSPTAIEVEGAEGQIIYAVIFCTSHDAGHYQMMMTSVPKYLAWKETKWRPTAERVKRVRKVRRHVEKARKRGDSSLDNFF
jgi:three-Cys-motif partner protein